MHTPFSILVASNDAAVRAACAHHFSGKRLACRVVDFDEKLLSEVTRHPPFALVGELSLRSQYFSPSDTDAAFNYLLAVKLQFPGMPVITLHSSDDPQVTATSKGMKFQEHFSGPSYNYAGIRAALQVLVDRKVMQMSRALSRRKLKGGRHFRVRETKNGLTCDGRSAAATTDGLSIALAHQRAKIFKFNMELSNNELWRMQKK